MQPFYDSHGMVTAALPMPADWQVMRNASAGQPTIVGPNGISVIDFPGQNFLYTNDPQMQQTYYRSGQQLRAMPGVEQLVAQDIVPWAAGQGLKLVEVFEVPEVSSMDRWYSDQLYKAMPSQIDVVAIGTQWVHSNGNPYFLLIHLSVSNGGGLQTWYYYASGLQAEKEHFERAKAQLIFALANARYNLDQIAAYNQREAQAAGQSWAAHNARMAQNQANFEAHQRDFVNRSNATNDAIMSGWRERNAASDKAHEQFVDVITERTNVVDPSTGTQYKVDSGANQYWMNNDGKYISTDSRTYDPNLDESMNSQQWQQLEPVE